MERFRKIFLGIIILLILLAGFLLYRNQSGHAKDNFPDQKSDETIKVRTIEEDKESYVDSLFAIEGVNAVGIGKCGDELCIKVYLEKETKETDNMPEELEGYK